MKILYPMLVILFLVSCKEQLIDNSFQYESKVISGRVLDNHFNKGIPAVNLTIIPGNYFTYSDSLGYFVFKNIPSGKYLIITEKNYFLSDSIEIDITAVDSGEVNISLIRESEFFYNFNFEVYEGYTNYESIEEPFTKINLTTKEIFGCSNFKILTNNYISMNKIDIECEGIILDGDCQTAMGPATADRPLRLTKGIYSLNIKQQDIIDKYDLIITDTLISVESTGNNLISEPSYNIYWRYPENSFALIGGTTEETKWVYYEFVELLKDSINLQEIIFPNYGKICYPYKSQGHYVDMPEKYFKYTNDEDFDRVGSLLNTYSKNVISNYSGIGIWICNWKNKKYFSWIL
jgi:hypothetical protein